MLRLLLVLSLGVLVGFVSGSRFAGGQEARTRREPQFENEHLKVWKTYIYPEPAALPCTGTRTAGPSSRFAVALFTW